MKIRTVINVQLTKRQHIHAAMEKPVMDERDCFDVTVEPSGLSFTTDAQTTLLAAALAAGLALPNSCRNGTCRTCMMRLVQGKVRYAIEWPGVSADEKQEGWILACVAQACSDLVVEEPRAGMSR